MSDREELLDRRMRQLRPKAEADGLPLIGRDPNRERSGEDSPGASRSRPFLQGGAPGAGEEAETDLGHAAEAREGPDPREQERKDGLQHGNDGSRRAERAQDTEAGEEGP